MTATVYPTTSVERHREKGLSLIELMIAMVLGLLLIAGVVNVFIGTQQTNRTQEAMSRVQESGRLALEFVNRSARQGGQSGCTGGRVNNLLDETDDAYDAGLHELSEVFSDLDDPDNLLRGDVLAVNSIRDMGLNLTVGGNGNGGNQGGGQGNQGGGQGNQGGGGQNTPPINVDQNSTGVPQGTIVMVANPDGSGCDVFQNTTPDTASVLQRSAGGQTPGNKTAAQARGMWSTFEGDIEVMELVQDVFYIRNNPNGIPSLYRNDDEVVEGVFDMQVEYGEDTNGNGVIDTYVRADNVPVGQDWSQFAAVRVHFLVYNGSEANVLDQVQAPLLFGGALFTPQDRRLYQVFTTTVAVRNLLQ